MFLSIDEVEQKLNTSAASGLSRKAARARFQKAGENAFFLLPHASLLDCVREVIAQPSVVLLLILSVLLMFFDQPSQGRTLLMLTVLYAALLISARLWSGHVWRLTSSTSRPLVRVIREGQMYLLDCTRLVPGDLVELESGDMIPCDLRLTASENLRVLTYLGNEKGEMAYVRTLMDASHVCATTQEPNDICLHSNMLYGGSVIEQGRARALVVETGKHTYIGALQGGFPLKTGQKLPETAQRTKNISIRLQIVLLLAILPLLCLCLLIGKNQAGLPLLFSTLLCLCLANLVGSIDTVLKFCMSVGVHRALSHESRGETALIKTEKSLDRLGELDVLFLLGPQAFSADIAAPFDATRYPNGAGLSNLDRAEEKHRRELRLALSEDLLATRENQLQQLRDAGVQPILWMEDDSRQTLTYVLRTGIADHVNGIATADEFRSQNRSVTAGWGQYQAYCGFSYDRLKELLITLRRAGKKVAILANSPREYVLFQEADVCFACINDMRLFTASHRTREKQPQISRGREDVAAQRIRQRADVLIPPADRHQGGIAAIVHTLQTVSDIRRNLIALTRYLLYTQLIRMTLVLPSMLMGINMVRPVQVLLSGLGVDLLFSLLLILRVGKPVIVNTAQHGAWKSTVVEAVFAGALTVVSFLFIYHHTPDDASAVTSLFVTLLLIQLAAFFLHWNPVKSLSIVANRRALLISSVGCLLFFLTAKLFGWLPKLGFSAISAPYGYLILIGPLAVVLVAVVVKLYQIGRIR